MNIKFSFIDADDLAGGIKILADDLSYSIVDNNADVVVTAQKSLNSKLYLSLSREKAIISYPHKAAFFRALAKLCSLIRSGIWEKEITETLVFDEIGAMVDMSRNGAMNVRGVKIMMRKMALMGMNTYMLYTEDNYEIDGYPYFGHIRGRYTKEEIKELDRYAIELGIELIPCVQMSGHLATHLSWGAAAPYKDTSSTLLVGAEATYKLIDAMLKSISECFTSRRLHMGMDEARDLGSGKYLELNGYKTRSEIFLEHLARVSEMVRSYGFEPMMWSDMFFRLAAAGKIPGYRDYDLRVEMTDEISEKVPDGITQVFWDYYHDTEDFYALNIDKHRKYLKNKTVFAGGVYLWCGHCPLFQLTKKYTVPALNACKDRNVREVLATVWLSGSEGMHILSLAGLALYADYAYVGKYDENSVAECFKTATGEDYFEILKLEAPEHPDGGIFSLSRPLLYNDPLNGNADVNFSCLNLGDYYKKCSNDLDNAIIKQSIFTPSYESIKALSELLENKADFGIRLKAAYDKNDDGALADMLSECDLIMRKIETLRLAHRKVWMEFCKPQGWEVHDIRYGGLRNRFDTVKYKLTDYLLGKTEKIEELDMPRLAIDCKEENIGKFTDAYTAIKYMSYATVNIL